MLQREDVDLVADRQPGFAIGLDAQPKCDLRGIAFLLYDS
jgi:hypothetical protein